MSKKALFANDALEQAMLRLLRFETVDQISITRICREAGVSRPSFYYYYKDVPQLAWISIRNTIRGYVGRPTGALVSNDALRGIFTYLQKNDELILNVRDSNMRAEFVRYMVDDVKRSISYALHELESERRTKLSASDEGFVVNASTSVFMGVIRDFVAGDLKQNIEDIVSQCGFLLNNAIPDFLEKRCCA